MLEIESAGDSFVWRPYALPLENWEFPRFYNDDERWVCMNSEVDDELLSFARCLKACELLGLECLEQYLPHRVGMQFGMDQDIPGSLPKSRGNSDPAWISYMPLDGWKLYLPSRAINGEVTIKYYNWWNVAFFDHGDPKTMRFSHDLDGNLEGEDEKAPPCSKEMEKSCIVGLELTGVERDIGKGKHTALEEDQQEIQESGSNIFIGSNENKHFESETDNNSTDQSLHAGDEVGEAPVNDLVVIDDDNDDKNNDSTSQFLAYVSGIEEVCIDKTICS
ncbi:hypothetical protein Cgig2_004613 [Carnegiea gigantea]|uniref:Aminotransferase-like plant mobile domain-containing protein n=1 Tax=Carnegiea gigantea TaxID=171969 RepID=A0A9Q1QA39_9CARY|nr:hypothetical protein Cgig2_004613 [Carnegiea gigantea]